MRVALAVDPATEQAVHGLVCSSGLVLEGLKPVALLPARLRRSLLAALMNKAQKWVGRDRMAVPESHAAVTAICEGVFVLSVDTAAIIHYFGGDPPVQRERADASVLAAATSGPNLAGGRWGDTAIRHDVTRSFARYESLLWYVYGQAAGHSCSADALADADQYTPSLESFGLAAGVEHMLSRNFTTAHVLKMMDFCCGRIAVDLWELRQQPGAGLPNLGVEFARMRSADEVRVFEVQQLVSSLSATGAAVSSTLAQAGGPPAPGTSTPATQGQVKRDDKGLTNWGRVCVAARVLAGAGESSAVAAVIKLTHSELKKEMNAVTAAQKAAKGATAAEPPASAQPPVRPPARPPSDHPS